MEIDGIRRLRRAFSFDDFAQALAFTNKIGELAEAEAHHPAVLTEWGSTTVTWWTHKIDGLHRNDFVMAAKTDQLFGDTAAWKWSPVSRRASEGRSDRNRSYLGSPDRHVSPAGLSRIFRSSPPESSENYRARVTGPTRPSPGPKTMPVKRNEPMRAFAWVQRIPVSM